MTMYFVIAFAVPAHAEDCVYDHQIYTPASGEVVTFNTCGGDDSSYRIPLSTPIVFDGVEYSTIYATTNSTITFGNPDGTYWDYPMTPSISILSMDWVVYPGWRADEHLKITVSDAGFQIDISARPIWRQDTPETTNITVTAIKSTDGSYQLTYMVNGTDWSTETQLRTGARLHDTRVVSLEEAGFTQVTEPPVVPPTPEPPVEPTDPPVDPTEPPVDPTDPPVEPTDPPVDPTDPPVDPTDPPVDPTDPPVDPTEPPVDPTDPPVDPTDPTDPTTPEEPFVPVPPSEPTDKENPQAPEVAPEEPTQPEQPAAPTTEELLTESPQDLTEAEVTQIINDAYQTLTTSEPGSEEYEAALDALFFAAQADDIVLDESIAAIPLIGNVAQGITDLINFAGNVGSDMSPEVRATAGKTIVAAVIVGQVAQIGTMSAMSSTSLRRN